jgi:hypothetical protein
VSRTGDDVVPAPWSRKGGGPRILPSFGCLIYRIPRHNGSMETVSPVRAKRENAMRKPVVLIAAAALLTGCSGSTTTTTTAPSAAKSPPVSLASTTDTAPTAEQTAWAAQVCTATATMQKDAQGLAPVTRSGGDVAAKLTAQMAVIKASANALATTITAAPVGSDSDPELAPVKASADQFKASVTALEASVTALEGKSASSMVTGLATVATAARTSLSKLGATGQAIKAAAKDDKSSLGQAFEAAPSCNSLNSE